MVVVGEEERDVDASAEVGSVSESSAFIIVDKSPMRSWQSYHCFSIFLRDLAIVRAKNSNSQIILSSATPSLETIFNCKKKKYKRVVLTKRVGDSKLPTLEIIDMKKQIIKKNRSESLDINFDNHIRRINTF